MTGISRGVNAYDRYADYLENEYYDVLDLPNNVSLDTRVNQFETADDYEDYDGQDFDVLIVKAWLDVVNQM